jgi:hypothetical protein
MGLRYQCSDRLAAAARWRCTVRNAAGPATPARTHLRCVGRRRCHRCRSARKWRHSSRAARARAAGGGEETLLFVEACCEEDRLRCPESRGRLESERARGVPSVRKRGPFLGVASGRPSCKAHGAQIDASVEDTEGRLQGSPLWFRGRPLGSERISRAASG